jgi:hypothetical protein
MNVTRMYAGLTGLVLAGGLSGGLAGCGSASPAAAAATVPIAPVTVTGTPVPTVTVTPTPTPTVTKTVVVEPRSVYVPAAPTLTACGIGTYGEEVYAGPDTSCPFALNVEQDWSDAPSNTFSAYSPVTGLSYIMSCNGANTNECTGANNALVQFNI